MAPAWRLFAAWLRSSRHDPLLRNVFVFGAVVIVASVNWAPSTSTPRGVLGSIVLGADTSYTWGLALAVLAGVAIGTTAARMWDQGHVAGIDPVDHLSMVAGLAMIMGLLARVVTMFAAGSGGLVEVLRRGGNVMWPSEVELSMTSLLSGQARIALASVLAATGGAILGMVVRRRSAGIGVSLVLCGLYLPIVGAVTNRAPALLDLLVWLPFGALRAVLTGNGAIFGDDTTHLRPVSSATAAMALIAWGIVGSTVLWRRVRRAKHGDWRSWAAFAPPLVLAGLIGWGLPRLVGDQIPWQWSPEWRHAEATGWSSPQVAERWVEALRTHDSSGLAELGPAAHADPALIEVFASATGVDVESANEMFAPDRVVVRLTFDPPVFTGNVVVDEAGFQLWLAEDSGRWLIQEVMGPVVTGIRLTPLGSGDAR